MLADLDDINAHLPPNVVKADDINSVAPSDSVERLVRSVLVRVVDSSVMDTWTTPESTPDTVREAASMLVASQIYFNATSTTSLDIGTRNFGQILYDRAMAMLESIADGSTPLPGVEISGLTYWPDDTAERSFTTDMQFS